MHVGLTISPLVSSQVGEEEKKPLALSEQESPKPLTKQPHGPVLIAGAGEEGQAPPVTGNRIVSGHSSTRHTALLKQIITS